MKFVRPTFVSGLLTLTFLVASHAESTLQMTVYRSPTCSCCWKWIEYIRQSGVSVKEVRTEQMAEIKRKFSIPEKLQSCHTAYMAGHVIEGHVPVEDVKKMLKSGPSVMGISVPGMPEGSPGMEVEGNSDDFTVISFDKNGKTVFLSNYPGK